MMVVEMVVILVVLGMREVLGDSKVTDLVGTDLGVVVLVVIILIVKTPAKEEIVDLVEGLSERILIAVSIEVSRMREMAVVLETDSATMLNRRIITLEEPSAESETD